MNFPLVIVRFSFRCKIHNRKTLCIYTDKIYTFTFSFIKQTVYENYTTPLVEYPS